MCTRKAQLNTSTVRTDTIRFSAPSTKNGCRLMLEIDPNKGCYRVGYIISSDTTLVSKQNTRDLNFQLNRISCRRYYE